MRIWKSFCSNAVAVLFLLFSVPSTVAAAEMDKAWLSLSREKIVSTISSALGAEFSNRYEFGELLKSERPKANASAKTKRRFERLEGEYRRLQNDLRKAGSTVWLYRWRDSLLNLAVAGEGNRVHSLKITLPLVDIDRDLTDRVFTALEKLFVALYPGWKDAKPWPKDSLETAWKSYPKSRIITENRNGIIASTFGVPPDIVVYGATVRDACVPDRTKGNPFRRVIC